MPVIPDFTDEWDGGAVLESSGLVSINGVSLENSPDWHSFTLNFGHAIRGTVAEASRDAFLAAIEAGSTGLPLTVYECHCDDPHLVSDEVEFDASWSYVIRGDALQPWGHSVAWKLKAARHVIVTEEITWTFDGDNAVGTFPTDPALNWWGFEAYPGGSVYEHWTWELEEGETWSGVSWDNEYTLEPVLHPLQPGNYGPYAQSSNGVQTGSGVDGALGTTYRHSVNNDNGMSIAWQPGWSGSWDFYARVPSDFSGSGLRYWSLYFTDDEGVTVSGGTNYDVASATHEALVAGWVHLTATIPTAPAGTEGVMLQGRSASGGGGLPMTYWVDEVTISVTP